MITLCWGKVREEKSWTAWGARSPIGNYMIFEGGRESVKASFFDKKNRSTRWRTGKLGGEALGLKIESLQAAMDACQDHLNKRLSIKTRKKPTKAQTSAVIIPFPGKHHPQ